MNKARYAHFAAGVDDACDDIFFVTNGEIGSLRLIPKTHATCLLQVIRQDGVWLAKPKLVGWCAEKTIEDIIDPDTLALISAHGFPE